MKSPGVYLDGEGSTERLIATFSSEQCTVLRPLCIEFAQWGPVFIAFCSIVGPLLNYILIGSVEHLSQSRSPHFYDTLHVHIPLGPVVFIGFQVLVLCLAVIWSCYC